MGVPVLILGESGSGKSTSLRNFEKDEFVIYNVAGKPLPFRGGNALNRVDNATYNRIVGGLAKRGFNCYVIDDSQYLLAFELFGRAAEKGYDKFTEMALHFYNLIQFVIRKTPPDCIVYFLHHTEELDGRFKAKTIGKMLDEKLTVEGLFSIVLLAKNIDGRHVFLTQSNGKNTVKTPIDMFKGAEIGNDLKTVDTTIREYYGMKGITE